MKLKKIDKLSLMVLLWGILGFGGSMLYYKMQDVGLIIDLPSVEGKQIQKHHSSWNFDKQVFIDSTEWVDQEAPEWFNGRKVIFGVVAGSLTALWLLRIILVAIGIKDIPPTSKKE